MLKSRKRRTDEEYIAIYEELYVKKRMSIPKISEALNIDDSVLSYHFRKLKLPMIARPVRSYDNLRQDAFDRWSVEMAYWLGFLVTKAILPSKSATITLKLVQSNAEHIEKFAHFLNFPLALITEENGHLKGADIKLFRITINSTYLRSRLESLGITPNRGDRDRDYRDIVPFEFYLPFVLGVYDGVGTYIDKGLKFTGHPKLIKSIQDYFITYVGFDTPKVKILKDSMSIIWSNKNIKPFIRLYLDTLGHTLPLQKNIKRFENIIPYLDFNPVINAPKRGVKPDKLTLIGLLQTKTILDISAIYEVTFTTTYCWCKRYDILD